jgi:hypothetical protein
MARAVLSLGALLTVASLAASCASAEEFVQVGVIPVACPIRLDRAPGFADDPNVNVKPEQAVETAAREGYVKCNSKLEQAVLADSGKYYIIKTIFGPITPTTPAIIIDARTGSVSIREGK